MAIRLSIIGLILITAMALGMIALQVARPPQTVAHVEQAAPPPLMVNFLTAARSLPAGTLIRDDDFVTRQALPANLPANALTESPETRASLRGALVKRFLDTGVPVTPDDVLRVRDRGFLAAVLDPGTRAAAIGVDQVSGVSGLIWPGDRVDVVLTQNLDQSTPQTRRVVSETVLQNIRVIAIDQEIARNAAATNSNGQVAHTVTLQVTPDETNRLAVARQLGVLSLAVRAIEDAPGTMAPIAQTQTFSKDVSSVLSEPTGTTVRVIQGDNHKDVNFQ